MLDALRAAGIDPGVVHACNTAGALAVPAARYDMVRVGIGIYGIAPVAALEGRVALRPALGGEGARLVRQGRSTRGTRVSYGLRYETAGVARIATVPIGYADGVPRELAASAARCWSAGARCPIAGTVTMDQLMVDVGDLPVEVGDEVVLLGPQGDEEITAEEWAERVDTIPYAIVCGIGPRVPRRYLR